MFELTYKGRTMQFKTAQEMEEWRQRMTSPTKTRRGKSKVKKTNVKFFPNAKNKHDENL